MSKHFEVTKVVDGEGREVYGVFRTGETEPVAVWDKRRSADAEVRELERTIAEDAEA